MLCGDFYDCSMAYIWHYVLRYMVGMFLTIVAYGFLSGIGVLKDRKDKEPKFEEGIVMGAIFWPLMWVWSILFVLFKIGMSLGRLAGGDDEEWYKIKKYAFKIFYRFRNKMVYGTCVVMLMVGGIYYMVS